MKLINANADYMQVFVIIKNVGIMKNVHANVKKWLINEDVTKNLFEILVFVNLNVINHVMLESI